MAITRVQNQSTSAGPIPSTGIFSITVPAPANGNFLVVSVSAANSISTGTPVITSILQTGATWLDAGANSNSSGFLLNSVWYATNVSNAGTTITFNMNASNVTGYNVRYAEYSGIALAVPLDVLAINNGPATVDKIANNNGLGTPADTGTTATTTTANELWWGFIWGYNGAVSINSYSAPTNGFSILDQSADKNSQRNFQSVSLEKIVGGTGTANCSVTSSNVVSWSGAIVTFKGTGGIARANHQIQSASNVSVLSQTFTVPAPTNGNTLIIGLHTDTGGSANSTISSISQNGANWQLLKQGSFGGASDLEIWFAPNVQNVGTSITINLIGNPATSLTSAYAEYSGLTNVTLDTGTTATTNQASELWWGSVTQFNGAILNTVFTNPTNSFTLLNQASWLDAISNGNFQSASLEKIVSGTGTANSGVTGNGTPWFGNIVTFKAAPAVASTNNNQLMLSGLGP